MKNTKEFEALKALVDSNFAMLEDGRTVYMTPTGEVRDMDTRLLLPADPIRAALYLKNNDKSTGTSIPSDVGAYKYITTDGDGNLVAQDLLAYTEPNAQDYISERNFVCEKANTCKTIEDGYGVFDLNETYTVFFDGTEYPNLTPVRDIGCTMVGNMALSSGIESENNGMRFLIRSFDPGRYEILIADVGEHTVKVIGPVFHTIDPVFLGFNIKSGAASHSEVFNNGKPENATSMYSHVEGYKCKTGVNVEFDSTTNTNGVGAHAEGSGCIARRSGSHAEGIKTLSDGVGAHSEGRQTQATSQYSHAEGEETVASKTAAHSEGTKTKALGMRSHAEGFGTIAAGYAQHVQGQYNVQEGDPEASNRNTTKYAHIVGNGTSDTKRSNAHTLDWDGNAWFAGGIELTSPNGTRYRFTVSDDGILSGAVVTE